MLLEDNYQLFLLYFGGLGSCPTAREVLFLPYPEQAPGGCDPTGVQRMALQPVSGSMGGLLPWLSKALNKLPVITIHMGCLPQVPKMHFRYHTLMILLVCDVKRPVASGIRKAF